MMPKRVYRYRIKSNVFKFKVFFDWSEKLKKGGDGIRRESKNNNLVGKEKETHKVVGSGGVDLWIDSKLLNAVRDDPLCGLKESGSLGHIPPGVFEGIDDEFLFEVFHGSFK